MSIYYGFFIVYTIHIYGLKRNAKQYYKLMITFFTAFLKPESTTPFVVWDHFLKGTTMFCCHNIVPKPSLILIQTWATALGLCRVDDVKPLYNSPCCGHFTLYTICYLQGQISGNRGPVKCPCLKSIEDGLEIWCSSLRKAILWEKK